MISILVAKMAALVYFTAGVAAVSGTLNFKKLVDDLTKSPALTFISGFMTLIIGVALVTFHNIWVSDWTVLVTIIGWAALVKGIMLIVYPKYLLSFKSAYKNTKLYGLLMIILGVAFGYFGFLS